jgi:hypothetical protein
VTVNTTRFYNWQEATKADGLRFRKSSPNLMVIKDYVMKRWQGQNLGCYGVRPIRGGESMSSHSYGAAWDWRYPTRKVGVTVANWLVKNSEELGIQAIHDYAGGRIWRSVREGEKGGWKVQKPNPSTGMGQSWASWLHVETTKASWKTSTRVEDRLPK